MVNGKNASLEHQIKELLEKNLAYTQEMFTIMKKIQRYILLGRIISIIYIILIVTPIVLGIIYLPNILRNTINSFLPSSLMESSNLEDRGLFDAYKNILDLQKNQ